MLKIHWPFILFIFLECSCWVSDKTVNLVGLGFNKQRAKIGLPLLDSTWTLVINEDGMLEWMSLRKPDSCIFQSKLVEVSAGKLKREENLFVGKKMFKTVDGSFREYLYVSYDFYPERNEPEVTYVHTGVGTEFRKYVTKEVADSLLDSWHLKKYFF